MRLRLRFFLSATLTLLLCLPVIAARAGDGAHSTRDVPVIDFLHTSWTARQGAPTGIRAITQTPDGWIWIGSGSGLYKFDGTRFLPATGEEAPFSAAIYALGTLQDGTLWVSYHFGGFSLLRNGRMRHYRPGDLEMPAGSVYSATYDAAGTLWIADSRGLYYLGADRHWHTPAPSAGAPTGLVYAVMLDRFGALWARSNSGAYVLPKGASQFERKAELQGYTGLARHPDGSLWTANGVGDRMRLLVSPASGTAPTWHVPTGSGIFMFDHTGHVWLSDHPGILRVGPDGTANHEQRLTAERGLSGDHVFAIFEDREQNIWIGTDNGLDRFTAPRLRALALPAFDYFNARAIAGGPGASAWVNESFLASPAALPRSIAPTPSPDNQFTALYRAPDGILWAGTRKGEVWTDAATEPHLLPDPPGAPAPWYVYAMAQDTRGTLWVSKGRFGLYAWHGGQWTAGGGIPGLASFAATTITADERGRVWFGSVNNQLVVLEDGKLSRYGTQDGLGLGTVGQVVPAGSGAWVGGENGLAYFDGHRFITVTGKGGEAFTGIGGLVFGRDGTLWIHSSAGISNVVPSELQRALREPGHQVQFGRLDHRDGLTGTVSHVTPVPSAVRSDDGTLWFSTTAGVFAFDPAALPRNQLVPPVVITDMRSGTAAYRPTHDTVLPAGTELLQIDFTALSYREPERMAFRYRLDGVDRAWREGGRERSAYYTNLGPGHYRFQVIASNDDGVWNTEGAALSFEIAPTVTQTLWFRALCMLLVLLAAWRLQVWWTRRSARRLAARMGERVAERERIARELHDTLLQSVQGLMMIFWSTTIRLAPRDRAPLESALTRASQVVAEGRDLVAGLRTTAVSDGDLAGALRRYGEPLARDNGIGFALRIDGKERSLQAAAADEAFAVAREAMWNAVCHAHAGTITVTLHYTAVALAVTVADDGNGIPATVVAQLGRPGHWGIPGMYERARTLGATLELASEPNAGTRWTLRIPAAIAFA